MSSNVIQLQRPQRRIVVQGVGRRLWLVDIQPRDGFQQLIRDFERSTDAVRYAAELKLRHGWLIEIRHPPSQPNTTGPEAA